MERKCLMLPLSYMYKEGSAGEVPIDLTVLEDIMLQLRAGENSPSWRERAVILGAENGVITRFFQDTEGVGSPNFFRPDKESLERVIQFWGSRKVCLTGLIHTHRNSLDLSKGDLEFVRRLLMMNPSMEKFYLGVRCKGKLIMYSFGRDLLEKGGKYE